VYTWNTGASVCTLAMRTLLLRPVVLMSRSVLQVGSDPTLLFTRTEVLRSAGYTVVSAHSLDSALRTLTFHHFDVVLLCHSLRSEAERTLTGYVRQHIPETRVLTVRCSTGTRLESSEALDSKPDLLLSQLLQVMSAAAKGSVAPSLDQLRTAQTSPSVSSTRSMPCFAGGQQP
jgi:CheY-like chemotaxis protein